MRTLKVLKRLAPKVVLWIFCFLYLSTRFYSGSQISCSFSFRSGKTENSRLTVPYRPVCEARYLSVSTEKNHQIESAFQPVQCGGGRIAFR